MIFSLSGGERHDAPEGRKLTEQLKVSRPCSLLMDRAYEDDKTRALAVEFGLTPVVPPQKNRLEPWDYDRELYKRRNPGVERLFRRLKGFRRVFAGYEKLDVMYLSFIIFVLIVDALK
jgi:transposase